MLSALLSKFAHIECLAFKVCSHWLENLQSLGLVVAELKDAAMLGLNTARFFVIVTIWIICINSNVSLATSADSLSAFGELSLEHKKAVGVELLLAVKKVSSIIECNLWCLNDKDCEATNYFAASDDSDGRGECELLTGAAENALLEQENATFTRLRKVGMLYKSRHLKG